ncbi:facilitated trehalose transporter Tret1-like [Epargyreus clarus]|uniref:facilitated trehalose transporter Tret1-like n=1 Tax=Epargyreus clarus TaxID=520877 RepID=UPI003C2EE368
MQCFAVGFMLSFPGILNQAILSPNATDLRATLDQASWIAASQGITGMIGFFIMPAVMQMFGRKTVHYVINLVVLIGFIIYFFATNIACLFAARLSQGLSISGVYITLVILAEYSSPKRRGYFISIKKTAVALGSLICHSFIVICTWRQIALLGAFMSTLAIIATIPWPESPAYLAMMVKFEECDKSYTWLNGNSLETRKELEDLITAQTERRMKKVDGYVWTRVWRKITRKDFLKPFLITTLLTIVIESCGRYYNIAYIVQIMTDVMKDKSVAVYCSMGSDILTIIALLSSSFVITNFKRRTILFSCGLVSVVLMLLVSLTMFLKNNNYLKGPLLFLPMCCILVNSFISNIGIMPICFTVSGEIFPIEHRGVGTCATGIVFTIFCSVVLKCTPILIDKTGVEGTYAIYGLCLFISLISLNLIMNETKDKSLQEIEDEIKGVKRNNELFVEKQDIDNKIKLIEVNKEEEVFSYKI